jgi:hypothetical protein
LKQATRIPLQVPVAISKTVILETLEDQFNFILALEQSTLSIRSITGIQAKVTKQRYFRLPRASTKRLKHKEQKQLKALMKPLFTTLLFIQQVLFALKLHSSVELSLKKS